MIKKIGLFLLIALFLTACGETEVEEKDTEVVEEEQSEATDETAEKENEAVTKEESIVLIDDSDVKVTYTGLTITNDEIIGKEAKVHFEIENNTEKLITVQQRNMSVDGYMVDETILSFSEDVSAGKKAKGSISMTEFEGYDFPEFNETMEFDLVIIDGESWENLIEKPVIINIH